MPSLVKYRVVEDSRLRPCNKQSRAAADWCRHMANSTKQRPPIRSHHEWKQAIAVSMIITSLICPIMWKSDVIHKTGSILHCRWRTTEPRSCISCIENYVKFWHVVIDIPVSEQTDRHTDTLIAILSTPAECLVIIWASFVAQSVDCLVAEQQGRSSRVDMVFTGVCVFVCLFFK